MVCVQMQDREADDQIARAEDTWSVEGEEPGMGLCPSGDIHVRLGINCKTFIRKPRGQEK